MAARRAGGGTYKNMETLMCPSCIVKREIIGASTIYRSFNNLASGEYIVRYKDANNSINQRLIIAK